MSNDSTRCLVEACLEGDQYAMRALVDRFRGPVFGICLRMLGQWQDAEDAAQETLVRALRYLRQWDPSRDFEPWLFAIAGNRCRTAIAKRSQTPPREPITNDLQDTSTQSDSELIEEVDLGLATLRIEYRQAFLLFHHQQLSYVEIAATLNCPVGTAKTWVHRARRELLEFLAKRSSSDRSAEVRKHAVR